MKSIKYSVLLLGTLLLWFNNSYTHSGWYSQNSETANDLFWVWFTDDSTGFAVGGIPDNCMLYTTDAGTTWSPQTYPEITGYLATVCFSDSMNGWVSGQAGYIIKTLDGGTTWTSQSSGTSNDLNAFFCISNDIAWAGGGNGEILSTTDGGDNWNSQVIGISSHLWQFYFFDADTGIAVTGACDGCTPVDTTGGFIVRTTNGGTDWSVLKHDTTTIGLYGVYFANSNTGTAVGANGTILRTTDGGDTWITQTSGTTVELWDVFFINSDTGFVFGGNWLAHNEGIILHTTDGGTTWTEQNIPTEMPLIKVFFVNDTTGTAVGNDGTILRTTNGGETWIEYIWPVSNNENIIEPFTRIYPNPSDYIITIEIENPNNAIIDIYNVSGRLVYSKELDSKVEKIDIEELSAGIYFVKVRQKNNVSIEKLIVY